MTHINPINNANTPNIRTDTNVSANNTYYNLNDIGADTFTRQTSEITAKKPWWYFGAKNVSKNSEPDTLVKQINLDNIKSHIETLASEDFAGRDSDDSENILKSENYIIGKFSEYGLKPFNSTNYKNPYEEGSLLKEQGNNLIGYIPGKNSDKYVFVTAHYDHLGKGYQGANDNASGVAAMLEMAKVLSKTQPEKNIVFVATSREEDGLVGAEALAEKLKAEGFAGKAEFINLDCLGGEGNRIVIEGQEDGDKQLLDIAKSNSDKLGIPSAIDRSFSVLYDTDADAFKEQDFPAIWISWAFNNDKADGESFLGRFISDLKFMFSSNVNSEDDTTQNINYGNVKKSTDVALATVWELSNS